ncbi:MAG: glycosyltransferase family 2 protein [Syntrophorhabdaceae bacterium]|nr:glycosyltransferase family 2 protein [Syntrophorhabdaceae bacterium]
MPTYNRPVALRLCIRSLSAQSMPPSEIIVADDGSGSETRDAVREMARELEKSIPVLHVWQDDDGFRKPKIINEAVRNASGEYLVFIDGDCMAHPDFIREHVEESDPCAILGGKRVDIGENLTGRLMKEERVLNRFRLELLMDSLAGASRKVEESIPIRNRWLRRVLHRDRITRDGIWGCNFSIYRQLFYDINGCDEDFLDGSTEDNDLGIRVLNLGGQVRSVRALAIVFHLYHSPTWKVMSEKHIHNCEILRRRIENRETRCVNGIVK